MRKEILLFIALTVICSCKPDIEKVPLRGKLVLSKSELYTDHAYQLYHDGIKDTLIFPDAGIQCWLSKSDSFLGIRGNRAVGKRITSSDLVLLDGKGRTVKTLIASDYGRFIESAHISNNDRLIVIMSSQRNPLDHLAVFNSSANLTILRYPDLEVVAELDNAGTNSTLDLSESPWSPTCNKITYALNNRFQMVIEGEHQVSEVKETGVFIYDFESEKSIKVADSGSNAVWSPVDDKIAFINESKLFIYDVSSRQLQCIYQINTNFFFSQIHWSPDGKYIFMRYSNRRESMFQRAINEEKLINTDNKEEIFNIEPRVGGRIRTWK